MSADAHDDVAQTIEGVDAVQLARGDQRVEEAGTFGAVLASFDVLELSPKAWKPKLKDVDAARSALLPAA
jgi:hypothetical protein